MNHHLITELRRLDACVLLTDTLETKISSEQEAGSASSQAIHMARKDGSYTISKERNFFISRDVVFDETCFPYDQVPENTGLVPVPVIPQPGDDELHVVSLELPPGDNTAPAPVTEATTNPSAQSDQIAAEPVALGRGLREKRPSVKLQDFVTYHTTAMSNKHTSPLIGPISVGSSAVQGNTLYPIQYYTCDDVFSAYHRVFLAAVTAGVEPKIFKEQWKMNGGEI